MYPKKCWIIETFKRVQLNASIDVVGDRDRYIPYPAWEKIEENFDKLNGISGNTSLHLVQQH